MTHVVFRVGPLERPSGLLNAYFVYPGRAESQVFFGQDDRHLLHQIVSAYTLDSIACERALAEVGHDLQLPVRDLSAEEAHHLGLVTFDLVLPNVFARSTRSSAIIEFARAAGRFADSKPWTTRWATITIPMIVSGSVEARWYGRLLGSGGGAPGLCLFRDQDAIGRMVTAVELGRIEEVVNLDFIGATLEDAPEYARDGMLRAYGLSKVPQPLENLAGKRTGPDDVGLLTLAGTLRTVSALCEGDLAEASVSADDLEIHVVSELP